jgi:hypothetical protein
MNAVVAWLKVRVADFLTKLEVRVERVTPPLANCVPPELDSRKSAETVVTFDKEPPTNAIHNDHAQFCPTLVAIWVVVSKAKMYAVALLVPVTCKST